MYKVGFILEQALGHITHARNLQKNVSLDPSIEPHWGLVGQETRGLVAKLPIYKSNWTVRAGVRARRELASIMRRTELDVLFFHTQVPAILAQDWLRRIPGVVSLDATPLQYDALGAFYEHSCGPSWLERQKWKLNRDCFRAACHLVTWSHWAKQSLIADYEVPEEKVTVIPPGVNPAEWACPTPRREHDGPVRILFVGGNLERKGGLMLLEAFRALRPFGVELHLVTRDSLMEEPGLFVHNNVQPNSERLKRLYHAADIFCLPTQGDCLPMVLSEAGAAGLPVVSTQVGAIAEVVQEGATGLLVPAGDVSALTEALRRLVENPALRLSQGWRAVQVVEQQFDAQRNTIRLLDVLKQVADESRVTKQVASWQMYY